MQWCNPLILQLEQSGGVGSMPDRRTPPLDRYDKGSQSRLALAIPVLGARSRNFTYGPSHSNRRFSYSENECGSNNILLQFVEFSNVHNCDRSSNAALSNLAYKVV